MGQIKEFCRSTFPRTFGVLRDIKDRCVIEGRVLRRVGVRGVVSWMLPARARWETELPVQLPRRIGLNDLSFATYEDIEQHCRSRGAALMIGTQSLYLPPSEWVKTGFGALAAEYPPGAGLKIVKRSGGLSEPYVHPDSSSRIQARLIPSHAHHTLVVNFFNAEGLGPRLYDLLEFDTGGTLWVAYVVEHVGGGEVDMEVCEQFVGHLRELVDGGMLDLINMRGFDDRDFICPGCYGNLIADGRNGIPRYVDLHNFQLPRYESYLRRVASDAVTASHFGQTSMLLGSDFLYQAVPGLGMPAKRDPVKRMSAITQLLSEHGETVEDKVVLDVGCNLGLMGAQYLARGARWVHGWDLPDVVPHANRILLAVGCTRFSLTGAELSVEYPLESDLPAFLQDEAGELVISYLAVRRHLGWLKSLARMPWRLMIYEGHESESESDTTEFLASLNSLVPVEMISRSSIQDAVSASRPMMLMRRMQSA